MNIEPLNADQITLRIDQRINRAKDTRELMKNISIDMKNKITRRFQASKDPDGKMWEYNTITTIERKDSDKVGTDTGRLRNSMTNKNTRTSASAGTNVVYARTFNYGAKKGQYGKTRRNTLIPWGDIPARRFIGFGKRQRNLYKRWITGFLNS